MFLGFCFGTAAVGAGAFVAGRSSQVRDADAKSDTVDPVLADKLAQLRRLAVAADEDLFAARPLFLVGLDAFRNDPVLWCGFQRIARMAVLARDHVLAGRMMKTATAGPVPAFVEPSLGELRALARDAMRDRGVTIEPNPAIEGRTVTITLRGTGPWYVSRDPSGTVTELTPDAQGQVEMLAPGSGGEFFTVTDTRDPPTGGIFEIVSTSPHP